jgi:hypothetical protein
MLPVSAVVTPPCMLMESDGQLSRQALGYDHDATRARRCECKCPCAKHVEDQRRPDCAEPASASGV